MAATALVAAALEDKEGKSEESGSESEDEGSKGHFGCSVIFVILCVG